MNYLLKKDATVAVSISDMEGKLIQKIPVPLNQIKINIEFTGKSKGLYCIILSNGLITFESKIIHI